MPGDWPRRASVLSCWLLAGALPPGQAPLHGGDSQSGISQSGVSESGVSRAGAPRLVPTVPGGVQYLTVDAPPGARMVQGRLFGEPVHLGAVGDGRWEGLLGVDVDRRPGAYPLTVTTTDANGRTAVTGATLTVGPRRFATRRLTVAARFLAPSPAERARIADESARLTAVLADVSQRRWHGAFVAPVAGAATSNFGTRSIFNGQPRAPHAGIDYRGAVGTPVAAPNAGRVVLAESLFMTGNTVVLDHGMGLFSLFAHLSRIDVQVGDVTRPGTVLGLVGATGRVTGPHLHWSVRLAGARIDPAILLAALTP